MEDTRPLKRARQACEPCRRKKSKCPGEKPICSYCERLGQPCVYESAVENQMQRTRQDKTLEHRMENLEEKLDFVIDRLEYATRPLPLPNDITRLSNGSPVLRGSRQRSASRQSPGPTPNSMADCPERVETIEYTQAELWPSSLLLPRSRHDELGSLYLTWLHRQPLVLFKAESFIASLSNRDPELVLALQSLAFRFPPRSLTAEYRQQLVAMARASRQLLMTKIFDGQVNLSTLQTLCLLSFHDYTEGNIAQAGLHLSMVTHFIRSVPSHNILGDPVEFNDCHRAILVLHHLQGSVSSSTWPTDTSHNEENFAQTPPYLRPINLSNGTVPSEMDRGILKYTIPLAQAWRTAREYAACRVFSDTLPPWNPRSDYSRAAYRHLEIDCSVPLKYRFSANKIGEQTSESLQQRRGHWGPYLFTQFIYASIPIILNHPFLLSMRLRSFRKTMPHSFINSSFDSITRHIGWIMYHLEVVEKLSFHISDPTLAHCVVIVATIHLQHSFVDDSVLCGKAQLGFSRCMEFLHHMGSVWPSVLVMYENLQKLQQSIQVMSLSSGDSAQQIRQRFSIDTRLLWDLLSYERAGRPSAQEDRSVFYEGALTDQTTENNETESGVGYDLVGSAGISGHKTVAKDTPLYAPGQGESTNNACGNRTESNASAFRESLQENIRENFGLTTEPDNVFLQADDFGRAIDEWLNLDSCYSVF